MVIANGYRLIETRYPTINVFDDCEDEEELRDVIAAKNSVNPRLHNLATYIGFDQIPYGIPGIAYAVAPFIFSDNGARFNPPAVGCLYAASEIETAKAEVLYHRAKFFAYNDKYQFDAVEFRVLKVGFALPEENWLDVTDIGLDNEIYDPALYGQSQAFGLKHKETGIQCIKFTSVRRPEGINFALYTPSIINQVIPCRLETLSCNSNADIHWADY